MNTADPPMVFHWPALPALPPPHQSVLIRVDTSPSHNVAREEARAALRWVLAAWSNLAPNQLPLCETWRGPAWLGLIGGESLDLSLAYAENEAWIGLVRAGQIGVDVMPIQNIPEAEAVTQLYLGDDALLTLQQSPDPMLAFAGAWTEFEARLKCQKCRLNEFSQARPALAIPQCAVHSFTSANRHLVTVVTGAESTARNVLDTSVPAPILFSDNARAKSSPNLGSPGSASCQA
jgi:hypothetical protein